LGIDLEDGLAGKAIAVVGMGYIGSRLLAHLGSCSEEIELDVDPIGRNDLDRLGSRTYDYVFNTAGNTGDFRQKPLETVESNIGLTGFILQHCSIREALVCLSSTRIYGFSKDQEKVFLESDPVAGGKPRLDSLYDDAKKLMESMMAATPRNYRKIVVRLSNVYGRYAADDMDDSTFLKVMLRHRRDNERLVIRQNPRSTKDYIFVDEAIDGILRAGVLSHCDDVYNICSGKSHSVCDWADLLGLSLELESDAAETHSKVSNEKALGQIGFQSRLDIASIDIEDLVSYE